MGSSEDEIPPPLRCPHCAGPLSKDMETEWLDGSSSYSGQLLYVMPKVRQWVKGPMWLHFLIGAPPVIVFSSACAGLAGGAVPALAQLTSSSYHAVSSPSISPSSFHDDQSHKSRTSTL